MERSFSNYNPEKKLKINLYSKVCDSFIEVEGFIKKMKHNNSLDHISVLGKVSGRIEQDFTCSTTAYFTNSCPMGIDFLYIPEIGKVFVKGSLSSLLLEKIDGKALGSIDGGLIGILNGYGVTNKKSLQYIEHLKNGKYIVVAREMKTGSKPNPTMSPQKE